ncbi:MAG: YhcH/YjgK/YiaL family protein [Paludibacteraceae bacterium]
MIYTTLSQSERIESLHPKFKKLFDFIKSNDLLNRETGRIELDGESLFINNVNSQMIKAEEQVLEVHRQYIDVHIPLDKAEIIGISPLENCHTEKSPYNEEQDYALYSDAPTNFVTVRPGEFLIVYPEDAHAPVIGEGKLRKLIAKVKLD